MSQLPGKIAPRMGGTSRLVVAAGRLFVQGGAMVAPGNAERADFAHRVRSFRSISVSAAPVKPNSCAKLQGLVLPAGHSWTASPATRRSGAAQRAEGLALDIS